MENEAGDDQYSTVVISNADQALELLEECLNGDDAGFDRKRVRFDGWPAYSLRVSGDDWHSSVPLRIMPPFIELQREMQRLYAQVKYSEPNLHRLTKDERELLELIVKVEEGSSSFSAALDDFLTRMGAAAADKVEDMSTRQVIAVLITIALTWGGNEVTTEFLKARLAEKELDVKLEASREETKRLELMTKMHQNPLVKQSNDALGDNTIRMMKVLKPADSLAVGTQSISGTTAAAITSQARAASEEQVIDGTFQISSVDSSMEDGFRIKIRNQADGSEIVALLAPNFPGDEITLIQRAEWSKLPIRMVVETTILRGRVVEAEILKATAMPNAGNDPAIGQSP